MDKRTVIDFCQDHGYTSDQINLFLRKFGNRNEYTEEMVEQFSKHLSEINKEYTAMHSVSA